MNAKQTPLVDILRLHAEDLHSDYGHNKSARLLSQAADEIERLRSNALALEEEKNDYMDGVGDVLGQDHDGETLWAAAQRVMSECDRLRAEFAEAKKFKDGMLDVLGGACPNDHRSTPFEEFKGCTPCLRAELAVLAGDGWKEWRA